jgi:hypothetical protein
MQMNYRRFHPLRDGEEQTSFLQIQQADHNERAAQSNSTTWTDWHKRRMSASYERPMGVCTLVTSEEAVQSGSWSGRSDRVRYGLFSTVIATLIAA